MHRDRRTTTLALIAALAAGGAVAGCGDDDEDGGGTRTVARTTPITTPANTPQRLRRLEVSSFRARGAGISQQSQQPGETTPGTTPQEPPPGDGRVLNNEALEANIRQVIESRAGVAVASVECDENVPAQANRVSFCRVTLQDGRRALVLVRQLDDQGTVNWQVI